MFIRILSFIIGFILTIIGMMSIILYFNLIPIGYSFSFYVNFIISRIECISLPIGLLILFLSLFIRRKKWNIFMI